jgi:hypothetical protein
VDERSRIHEFFDPDTVGGPDLDRITLSSLIFLHAEDQISFSLRLGWRKVLDPRPAGPKCLIDAPFTDGFATKSENIYALVRVAGDTKPVLYVLVGEAEFRLRRNFARLNTREAKFEPCIRQRVVWRGCRQSNRSRAPIR